MKLNLRGERIIMKNCQKQNKNCITTYNKKYKMQVNIYESDEIDEKAEEKLLSMLKEILFSLLFN
jgi:hypothetical protein